MRPLFPAAYLPGPPAQPAGKAALRVHCSQWPQRPRRPRLVKLSCRQQLKMVPFKPPYVTRPTPPDSSPRLQSGSTGPWSPLGLHLGSPPVLSLPSPDLARILLSQFRKNPPPSISDHPGLPSSRILCRQFSKNPPSPMSPLGIIFHPWTFDPTP